MPTRLKRAFGVLPGREFLPYCYNSIKAKCFLNGRRVCSGLGHSCMRRIVSYAQWPARKVWRQAGKALAFLLQETLITDEVWSLKNARRDIESKIDRLLPPRQAGVCDRCHNAYCGLQGVIADAGQFFECVSAQKACAALDQVARQPKGMHTPMSQ